MPEASVHEDANLLFSEYKIRLAEQILFSSPAGHSVGPEYRNQFHFRRLVSMRQDPSHQLRAGGCGEDVSHQLEATL